MALSSPRRPLYQDAGVVLQAVHDLTLLIVGRPREEKPLRDSSPRCVTISIEFEVAGNVFWCFAFTKKQAPRPRGLQAAVGGGFQERSNQLVVARGAAFAQHEGGRKRYSRALLDAVGRDRPLLIHLRVRISSHSSPRSSAVSIRKGDLHSGRPDGTSPNQMMLSPSPYVLNRLRRSVAVALRKASRSVPFSSAARFIRSSAHQSCLTVRVAISHRRLLLFLRPMMETDRTRCTDPMTQGRAEVSVP